MDLQELKRRIEDLEKHSKESEIALQHALKSKDENEKIIIAGKRDNWQKNYKTILSTENTKQNNGEKDGNEEAKERDREKIDTKKRKEFRM